MPFPSPPWQMHAQAWMSLFRVPSTGREDRPPGVYGVAFVRYEEPSPLTYRELVVARLREVRHRRVMITDIWVDSEASRAGGRSLWAIPKELAALEVDDRRVGPASHTSFAVHRAAATHQGRPSAIAAGRFAAVPGAALLRTPYAGATCQSRPDGTAVLTPLRGSARTLPALATWDFAADGPLAFLRGRRPVVSFRLRDARLTFG